MWYTVIHKRITISDDDVDDTDTIIEMQSDCAQCIRFLGVFDDYVAAWTITRQYIIELLLAKQLIEREDVENLYLSMTASIDEVIIPINETNESLEFITIDAIK